MRRVTDEQALHALTWLRNYGDIEGWEKRKRPRGDRSPKWLVTFRFKGALSIDDRGRMDDAALREAFGSAFGLLAPRAEDIVPRQMALTNREVYLMAYGVAIGAEREIPSRDEFRKAWRAGRSHPEENPPTHFRISGETVFPETYAMREMLAMIDGKLLDDPAAAEVIEGFAEGHPANDRTAAAISAGIEAVRTARAGRRLAE